MKMGIDEHGVRVPLETLLAKKKVVAPTSVEKAEPTEVKEGYGNLDLKELKAICDEREISYAKNAGKVKVMELLEESDIDKVVEPAEEL